MEWNHFTSLHMKNNNTALKRWLMALMLALPLSVFADDYLVYSVVGSAKLSQGGKEVGLQPSQSLTSNSRLIIGDESAVTVLDETNSKMYSFTKVGSSTVSELVASAHEPKSLSKQYLSYMVKQIFSKESKNLSHPNTYMQSTATSYRATSTDSLLLNKISNMFPSGVPVESSVIQPQQLVSSDLDVRFELINATTGLPINREVDINTSCYIRVTNDTLEPLYVNVLDIDTAGNKYLVLPVDEAAICAHLLVPARSTVSFKSEPFEFTEPKSKETFLLIATEEPVDFSILMSPIQGNGGKELKSGIYRLFYETK